MTLLYPIVFLILLVAALWLGWTLRKWIDRFENMESIVKRRDLPNAVKAGLEDIWSLADLAKLFQGNSQQRLIALAMLLKQELIHDQATSAVLDAILKDTAQLRRDPKGYDPDEPLKDK